MNKKDLLLGVRDKPGLFLWFVLSFQHVIAMFSATILIPIIVGIPPSIALFTSGLGTLIYSFITKAKVPVYLGSSAAFVGAMLAAQEATGSMAASQTGLILVGFVYVLIAFIIRKFGSDWLSKLLPPVVIGPMILVIGLGLAPWAVEQAGFVQGGDLKNMVVATFTLSITLFFLVKGKGLMKFIPFLVGILAGYIFAGLLNMVDFAPVLEAPLFQLPEFSIWGLNYRPDFSFAAIALIPVVIVSISEHIGDHTVLGKICGEDFLKDPGMDKTLMGDGIATAVSAFFGGPANTTYGENTGVIGMTKVASVYVTIGAAFIAILLSFSGVVSALIASIPPPVLGGVSLLLYGVIASNGLKVLIDEKVDFKKQRNLIIASIMLVLGLGGATLPLVGSAVLSGSALSGIAGTFLNFILPKHE
ncbi:MAG: uracil permease [Erysipelothrix sp.]|nr:uracil permease [Erysipelothrix sp.]